VSAGIRTFFAELRRRKVYRVAVAYLVVGWAVVTGAQFLFEEVLNLPEATWLVAAGLIVLGFPVALVLAWAYEVRPEQPRALEVHEKDTLPGPDSAQPIEFQESKSRKSIVVLPFDSMSPDPNDAYFSDGLTEEIITNLSHIRSLRVISRSSAMVLKSTQKDVRTIGQEFDVQYVLEGSVRRSGDDLRITAQLIDARTDEHLWAERYEGTMEDVFQIQEEASKAIVEALHVEINPGELERLVERPIDDVRAYECYLRARNELHKGTAESMESARRHLEAALEIVGENWLLYQGMAEFHLFTYEIGVKADDETLQLAEECAARVMALRPESAGSHYLRGGIERHRGTVERAARHFKKALDIDENHAGALFFLVFAHSAQFGRPSAADQFSVRLATIDPLSPLSMFIVGFHHLVSGRLNEALATFDSILELEPDFHIAVIQGQALALLWQDRPEEALGVLAPIAQRDLRDQLTEYAIFLHCAIAGDSVGATEALSENTRKWFWNDPELPWFGASAFALAGAKDEALTWLERAVEKGWINYPLFSVQDPFLESIRGEERFKELMIEVKARWETFEA
jgi:TolB-like protein/Flp pilus assembly protein TadD